MSARNPLTIIKGTIWSALNRAYYFRKLRNTSEIVDAIDKEVVELISPSLLVEMRRAWIRDMITSRLEQTDFFKEQPDLFRDLDYQFAFKKGRETYQCALGDLTLTEVEALERRKLMNIETAVRERDRFSAAVIVIKPLLEANPNWRWRNAVKYLAEHGGLPPV